MNETDFRQQLRDKGYGEPQPYEFPADLEQNQVEESPTAIRQLGEFALTVKSRAD